MTNSESIEGATFYEENNEFYMESTQAYDEGCIAGATWMDEGGDSSCIPSCPYTGKEGREWANGFNIGAGEIVF